MKKSNMKQKVDKAAQGRNWLHVWMMTSDHPHPNSAGPATYIGFSKRVSNQTWAAFPLSFFLLCQTGFNQSLFISKQRYFYSPVFIHGIKKAPGHACLL